MSKKSYNFIQLNVNKYEKIIDDFKNLYWIIYKKELKFKKLVQLTDFNKYFEDLDNFDKIYEFLKNNDYLGEIWNNYLLVTYNFDLYFSFLKQYKI